jgi:alpha-glucosidase
MADPWRTLPPLRYDGREGPRFVFRPVGGGSERVVLTVLESDVVRVQVQPLGHARVDRTWAVVGRAGDVGADGRDREDLTVFACPEPSHEVDGERLRLSTDRFLVEVTPAPFALRWALPGGEPLFADHPELAYRMATDGGRGLRHTLRRDLGDVYLGLGEASGTLDRHHRRYRLRPGDALGYDAELADPLYKHLPVVLSLSPSGHAGGVLYDSGAEATFDLGSEIDHYLGPYRYAQLQATELDAYVLIGPALSDVVRRIQDLTGYAPLPPRWSLGYLGSTMRYTDAEDPAAELAGFVDALREHRIGCSGFHLSSGYSLGDDGLRYVFEWNRRRVPDPAAMVAPLLDAGIRTLANVKPALLTTHPDHAALAAAGALVRASDDDPDPGDGAEPGAPAAAGPPYRARFWGGDAGYVDFTAPTGYAWWRDRVRERILDYGIDATWNDNNEFRIEDDAARCAAGEAGDLRPTLTLLMNHASRAAQRSVHPDRRDYQITRSAGLGAQRYAQTWSGDNLTSWKTLAFNLPMGLSLSLSGWANHGHDVGGFAGPAPDAELLLRWIEAGISQPRFSIHSWNDDGSATEPWTHPSVLAEVRRLMALRTALVPYLATLMWRAVHDGVPLTRPLVYAFQDWRPGWRESFVHMLGDALLVAPVLERGATRRRALLPPGSWLELGSGAVHDGDAEADLDAPLGRPVWLLREGHALPLAAVDPDAPEVVPAWLAGGPAVPPPVVRWLCFPTDAGEVRGSLVWEDGLTRAFERGAVDLFELAGGVRAGAFGATLRARQTASGCGVGAHEAWLPRGDARIDGLGATWTRSPLPIDERA